MYIINNLDQYNNVLINDDIEDLINNYINASFISVNLLYKKGPKTEDNKFFIATQGPLPSTFSSFWRMIYNKKISLVIMLCKMEEDSRVIIF
jgi:protein tyrosine phosphatase